MKKYFLVIILFFSLSLYGVSVFPPTVQAIEPLLTDSLIKDAECSGGNCSLNTFIQLGVNVSNIILGLVGSLTLAMFVYGGVILIISGGNSERISKGKEIILGSVVGLLIVFGSYVIIDFVANDLLQVKPGFDGKSPKDIQIVTIGEKCQAGGGVCMQKGICKDAYGKAGNVIDSDCSADKNCCILKQTTDPICGAPPSDPQSICDAICRGSYSEIPGFLCPEAQGGIQLKCCAPPAS